MKVANIVIAIGAFVIFLGLLMKLGINFGSLPGDFRIEKGNTTLYFPLTTSIIISILLTLAFWLYRYLS